MYVYMVWYLPVAKPARHFGHAMPIFWVYRPYKESISKEMNNDNDLNLHSMTKLSGWLRRWYLLIISSLILYLL